jgi:hypothetical protein
VFAEQTPSSKAVVAKILKLHLILKALKVDHEIFWKSQLLEIAFLVLRNNVRLTLKLIR